MESSNDFEMEIPEEIPEESINTHFRGAAADDDEDSLVGHSARQSHDEAVGAEQRQR